MFFLYLILFITIIAILLMLSKIQIEIENIKFTSYKVNNRHLQEDYKIKFKLYILSVVRVFKIEITKTKLEKLHLETKIKDIETKLLSDNVKFDLSFLKLIKELEINLEKLNFKILIGTENAALTSIIFAIISGSISVILKDKIKDINNQNYEIIPIYNNENLLNINLDCIFSIKMIHIIYIIYILSKKRRDDKYVRTSNRRTYGYSYE